MEEIKNKAQLSQDGVIAEAVSGVGTVLYADTVALLKANTGSTTRPIAVLGGYDVDKSHGTLAFGQCGCAAGHHVARASGSVSRRMSLACT